MPPLPKEDAKIVLQPRGGLDVSKVGVMTVGRPIMKASGIDEAKATSDVTFPNLQQNIVVVSTPDRENVLRYTRTKTITVASKIHEVDSKEVAPYSMCKGVIRGISLSNGSMDLEKKHGEFKETLDDRGEKNKKYCHPYCGFRWFESVELRAL